MPHYAILLRDDFGMSERSPADQERLFQQFVDWSESLFAAGHHAGVERLDREGRTVRSRDGNVVVDGPYTEGKELIMGFFVVEAPDIDTAAQIAAGCPSVPHGAAVEVRPIAPFPKPT
jgi:hypothetical protein